MSDDFASSIEAEYSRKVLSMMNQRFGDLEKRAQDRKSSLAELYARDEEGNFLNADVASRVSLIFGPKELQPWQRQCIDDFVATRCAPSVVSARSV